MGVEPAGAHPVQVGRRRVEVDAHGGRLADGPAELRPES